MRKSLNAKLCLNGHILAKSLDSLVVGFGLEAKLSKNKANYSKAIVEAFAELSKINK